VKSSACIKALVWLLQPAGQEVPGKHGLETAPRSLMIRARVFKG